MNKSKLSLFQILSCLKEHIFRYIDDIKYCPLHITIRIIIYPPNYCYYYYFYCYYYCYRYRYRCYYYYYYPCMLNAVSVYVLCVSVCVVA